MYLDVWRSGTFPLYTFKMAFWTQETLPRLSDVEHSVVLRSMFVIGRAFTYLPPYIQLCHCTWLGFTRPSPTLVLQATNAGVRRPGYEAVYSWPTYSWPAYSWPMYSQPDLCTTEKRKVLGYHSHQVLNMFMLLLKQHINCFLFIVKSFDVMVIWDSVRVAGC